MTSTRMKADFPALTTDEVRAAFTEGYGKQFPPILTVDQAAELLQVPKATIYEWSSRGLLKSCSRRIGKHLRILRDRFLKQSFEHEMKGPSING